MDKRPFKSKKSILVVLPTDLSALTTLEALHVNGYRKVIEEHRAPIERELGTSLTFSDDNQNEDQARWLIGPFKCNPLIQQYITDAPSGPEIFLDRQRGILITHGRDPAEVVETFSYLRSLNQFEGGVWQIKDCDAVQDAIERIVREVRYTYPTFKMRNLSWDEICERYIPVVQNAADPIPIMQQWLAELQDAHTWVRAFPPLGELPYDILVENNQATFYRLPEDSLAFRQGVRVGDRLMRNDLDTWIKRTAASPHSRSFVVGRRILSAPPETELHIAARTRDGKIVEWLEKVSTNRWHPIVAWKTLPSGNGYLRIQAWLLGHELEEKIDEAFIAFKNCPKLIVDLRGNPGGNLILAQKFRNRFLTKAGTVGWIQNTLPNGELCEKEPIYGEPSDTGGWHRSVRFLTDALTYSASEDALLGLQGLEHVKIVGQRSGGGSGRMRTIRLLPGWRLTISSAMTYDRSGHCIEGNGIPVDYELPIQRLDGPDKALELADSI